jgi:hypothetical protein
MSRTHLLFVLCPAGFGRPSRRKRDRLRRGFSIPSQASLQYWVARHRRAEATPSFGRLCRAMTAENVLAGVAAGGLYDAAGLPEPRTRIFRFASVSGEQHTKTQKLVK